MNARGQADPSAEPIDAAIFELVRKAWAESAGVRFEPHQTWQEAGADSMTSLHLLLALEQALARRLSFDLIDPEMTGHDLVRALERLERRTPPGPHHAQAGGTPIFLLPGIHGDEPRLAEFRRAFGTRVRFEVVELPELDEPAALLADIAATGRHAARQIARRQPRGALLLAGYSFGGTVAFEAARHLRDAGRDIAWLAILDTRFADAPWRRPWWRLDLQLIRRTAGIDAARRALLAAVRHLAPGRSIRVRQLLLDELRLKALRRWQPEALDVATLIAASIQADAAMVERWRQLCPGGELLRLPAGHFELFRPPSRQLLMVAFESAAHAAAEARPAPAPAPAA